jgi:hypothetical protein
MGEDPFQDPHLLSKIDAVKAPPNTPTFPPPLITAEKPGN